MELDAISLILLALAIPASFIVSAAAGLGDARAAEPAAVDLDRCLLLRRKREFLHTGIPG